MVQGFESHTTEPQLYLVSKGGAPEENELSETSTDEGHLTMGENGGAEHQGREIYGGLLHEVQRASTRDMAVRRERRWQILTLWSWEGGEVHLELHFIF